MENLVRVGVMSHYYTQLYIEPLCQFKIKLFKLKQAGFRTNNSSIKCILELHQKCSLIMTGVPWQDSTVVSWEKNSASFSLTKGTAAEPHLSISISQKPSVLDVLSIPMNKGSSSSTEMQSVPEDLLHLHSK